MPSDPFAGYDAWLERPYQQRYAQADAEEAMWEARGISPDEIEPPHNAGDACPVCGEPDALAYDDDETGGVLYCTGCDKDIDRMESPTFDIHAWAEDQFVEPDY